MNGLGGLITAFVGRLSGPDDIEKRPSRWTVDIGLLSRRESNRGRARALDLLFMSRRPGPRSALPVFPRVQTAFGRDASATDVSFRAITRACYDMPDTWTTAGGDATWLYLDAPSRTRRGCTPRKCTRPL